MLILIPIQKEESKPPLRKSTAEIDDFKKFFPGQDEDNRPLVIVNDNEEEEQEEIEQIKESLFENKDVPRRGSKQPAMAKSQTISAKPEQEALLNRMPELPTQDEVLQRRTSLKLKHLRKMKLQEDLPMTSEGKHPAEA